MPLPIKVIGTNGETKWLRLENSSNNQLFIENIDFVVSQIVFDPNFELISKNNSVTLGITNLEYDSISIFPNPVTNQLTIQSKKNLRINKIKLYNSYGQLLMNTKPENSTIDISTFSTGVLTLEIETNKGLIYKTLLKD
jgi:hypothetical protein